MHRRSRRSGPRTALVLFASALPAATSLSLTGHVPGIAPVAEAALVLGAALVVKAVPVGPSAPAAEDFQQVTLAKGEPPERGEPMTLAVLSDRSVLHTSRDGTVRLTDAGGTTKVAGRLPVHSHDEEGLQGVGIDPASPPTASDAEALALPYIGTPSVPDRYGNTIDAWKRAAAEFHAYGAAARTRGMRFYRHHHAEEFAFATGNPRVRLYDVLLAETDPGLVFFEMDIFWAYVAEYRFSRRPDGTPAPSKASTTSLSRPAATPFPRQGRRARHRFTGRLPHGGRRRRRHRLPPLRLRRGTPPRPPPGPRDRRTGRCRGPGRQPGGLPVHRPPLGPPSAEPARAVRLSRTPVAG